MVFIRPTVMIVWVVMRSIGVTGVVEGLFMVVTCVVGVLEVMFVGSIASLVMAEI